MDNMKEIIAILVVMNISITFGQNSKVQRANESFDKLAYKEAIASYESLVDQGLSDESVFKNLGDANYFNADYNEAW